jgi:hypothetical protein
MTEAYGCFFIGVCIYAALAIEKTDSGRSATRWLWILTLSGILGGSNRQVVWIAPIVLIPYVSFMKRRNRRFIAQAAASYALCASVAALVLIELSQPYAPFELSRPQLWELFARGWFVGSAVIANSLMSGLLVALPALLCLSSIWRTMSGVRIARCFLASIVAMAVSILMFSVSNGLAPFLGNILTPFGILKPGQDALGPRPLLLSPALRLGLTALLFFSVAASVSLYRTSRSRFEKGSNGVFGLFSGAYVLTFVPGAFLALTFDRYLLPLLPLFVIFLLISFRPLVASPTPVAWTCLALFAGYSIATTHDYYSGLRARTLAAETMQNRAIARNQISAGFEYDAWTQVQSTGKMELFHYNEIIEHNNTNKFGLWAKTPAITPKYVVIYSTLIAPPDKRLLLIPFAAWLPPFERAVVVLRFRDLPGGVPADKDVASGPY